MSTLKTKTSTGWQAISAIVEKAYVQANEPSRPVDGDIWIDTDETATTFLPSGSIPMNSISNLEDTIIGINSNISTLSSQISTEISKTPFAFGIDQNGNYGYIKNGADTVIPFKEGFVESFTNISEYTHTVKENSNHAMLIASVQANSSNYWKVYLNGTLLYQANGNGTNIGGGSSGWGMSISPIFSVKRNDIVKITSTSTSYGYVFTY